MSTPSFYILLQEPMHFNSQWSRNPVIYSNYHRADSEGHNMQWLVRCKRSLFVQNDEWIYIPSHPLSPTFEQFAMSLQCGFLPVGPEVWEACSFAIFVDASRGNYVGMVLSLPLVAWVQLIYQLTMGTVNYGKAQPDFIRSWHWGLRRAMLRECIWASFDAVDKLL